MGELLYFTNSKEQDKIINKMIKQLDIISKKASSFEKNDMLLHLFARISNFLGASNRYNDSILMSDKGISISLKFNEHYLLDYFYYYKALCLNKLNLIKERNEAIIDCYMVYFTKKDSAETKKFLNWFKVNFKINDFNEFLSLVQQK